MIIYVDEEGKKQIEALCDIALKQGGLITYNGVGQILGHTKIIPEKWLKELAEENKRKPESVKPPTSVVKKLRGGRSRTRGGQK